MSEETYHQLTLLPEDSHVRMSALPESGLVSKRAPDPDYGSNSTESFASYDPDTSSWRTSQASLLTEWEEFLETWPQAGTMRSGKCYRQQMWEHPISDGGCGLWPTPSTVDRASGGTGKIFRTSTGSLRRRNPDGTSSNLGLAMNVELKEGTGRLNPTWVEWLQGFPMGWTDVRPSETQ